VFVRSFELSESSVVRPFINGRSKTTLFLIPQN